MTTRGSKSKSITKRDIIRKLKSAIGAINMLAYRVHTLEQLLNYFILYKGDEEGLKEYIAEEEKRRLKENDKASSGSDSSSGDKEGSD